MGGKGGTSAVEFARVGIFLVRRGRNCELFDRNAIIQRVVAGFVYDAHTAGTNQTHNLIVAQVVAGA